MADVFDVLGDDHRRVRDLLDALEGARPGRGGSLPPQGVAELVERLVIEESRHEAVEEMYFWPVAREKLPEGASLAADGLRQEDTGKRLLERLRTTSPSDEGHDALLGEFIAAGRDHIAFEETQVWPRLAAFVDDPTRVQMGTSITEAKAVAPTRPHPHAPANAAALKTAGMGMAMLDKLRDRITGRGED